jgi:hypothetical protein
MSLCVNVFSLGVVRVVGCWLDGHLYPVLCCDAAERGAASLAEWLRRWL